MMLHIQGHPLAIDQLTTLGATPEEMVEVAAALDVGLIGPITSPPGGWVPDCFDLRAGTADMREMKAALDRTGVRINNMDGAALTPETNWEDMTQRVEGAAELGARAVVTLSFDPDTNRFFDGYCRLGEMTKQLGLLLIVEFTPLSFIADLAAARGLVAQGGFAHARILVDAMHVVLSGGSPADFAGLGGDVISGAQFCDGPLHRSMEEYRHDAVLWRDLPGEGEYPLQDFIRALPDGCPVALEIPRKADRDAGMSPLERARQAVESCKAMDAAMA